MRRPGIRANKVREMIPMVQDAIRALVSGPNQLLRRVRPAEQHLRQMNQDEAFWLYHALVAIEVARREGPGAVRATEELEARFAVLADQLRLPRPDRNDRSRWCHSPQDYDPTRVKVRFTELMDRLEQLLPAGP